jgi:hypothetical protein
MQYNQFVSRTLVGFHVYGWWSKARLVQGKRRGPI